MGKKDIIAAIAMVFCLAIFDIIYASTLQLHVADKLTYVSPDTWQPPENAPAELRIAGLRNGCHAGQLVVSSPEPIEGLKTEVSSLKGPQTIPSSAWDLRYGLPDTSGKEKIFDGLEIFPPAAIVVGNKNKLAVQNIWLRLRVPVNAKPGNYKGEVVVTVNGEKAVMPIAVKVHDWVLPAPRDWSSRFDAIQSPETVAMAYDVEPWSDSHLALLDKTFELLGELGQKTLFITVIRRTHFGNEHAMVRWVRDEQGVLQPDFEIVEKYLNVATKHLGKVPGVVFYSWEPIESMGHAEGTGAAHRTTDRAMQYTLFEPEKGTLAKRTGPAWGTDASKEMWGRFNKGIKPVLAKFGLEESKLFGLIGDARPTKIAMDDICSGDDNPRWAVHSHHYCDEWQGYKIGYAIALWGINLDICDPNIGLGFGWNTDFWLSYYPRELKMFSDLTEFRYKMEMWNGGVSLHEMKYKGNSRYSCGLGRIGGDFWKVVKDQRGNLRSTLAGVYPETYWGQLNLNLCISSILAQGAKSAIPTVRSEAFREGSQDAEVRIFIEKAVEQLNWREKLGEELSTRLREQINDRIRFVNLRGGTKINDQMKPPKVSDPLESSDALYTAAAEVAAKLGVMQIEKGGGDLYFLIKAREQKK